jgi:hypothetical protein
MIALAPSIGRPLAAALLATLALSACGDGSDDGGGDSSGTRTRSTAPAPVAPAKRTSVAVYLLHGEQVRPARRQVAATPRIGAAALGALLSGPTDAERAAGLRSAIPAGTSLLSVAIADGRATVDLTRDFVSGGNPASLRARLAQVVFTLTRFPTVRSVAFELDGEPFVAPVREGERAQTLLARRHFEDVSPAILVESPAVGETATSPLVVSGTANTFEATVHMRVLDARGRRLAERFTTATSGSGTRGSFQTRIAFEAPPGASRVTLMAFEASAATGEPTKVVRVPVALR